MVANERPRLAEAGRGRLDMIVSGVLLGSAEDGFNCSTARRGRAITKL
jgi:hypothetical protein